MTTRYALRTLGTGALFVYPAGKRPDDFEPDMRVVAGRRVELVTVQIGTVRKVRGQRLPRR